MTPQVLLFKAPDGAEMFACPPEMDLPRKQMAQCAMQLMLMHNIRTLRTGYRMCGPSGVCNPSYEEFKEMADRVPEIVKSTRNTVLRHLVPLLLLYGIIEVSFELEDEDRVSVSDCWGRIAKTALDSGAGSGVEGA